MFDVTDLNSIVSVFGSQPAAFFAASEDDVIDAYRVVDAAFLAARIDGDVRECGRIQPTLFALQDALDFHART